MIRGLSGATAFIFRIRRPMLPEALSNGIAADPNEDRLTKTVAMKSTARRSRRSRFFNSIIRSQERMTYTACEDFGDQDPEHLERYRDLVNQFNSWKSWHS
jgi:exoribonuclease R